MDIISGFGGLLCVGALLFVGVMYLFSAIRVIPEYERGVIFRLGRLVGARGPGLFFVWPPVERMIRVDTRVLTMDVPAQEVITLDNVTIKVNAVLYFMVVDPNKAVVNVMDYIRATMQIAQTTVRSVMGKVELDTLLADRARINTEIQQIIDEQTEPWGVKVTIVEIKDVELPQMMQRAMARQAEAEREKRAKIIHAEGEFQASQQLANAADIIANEPVTLQLRYLQTLTEIATEKNSTILFPFPIDIVRPFLGMLGTSEEMELKKAAVVRPDTAKLPPRQPAQLPTQQAQPQPQAQRLDPATGQPVRTEAPQTTEPPRP
jgi:regulator of protease activity HflC (stomatin/prohibitin superfamily)